MEEMINLLGVSLRGVPLQGLDGLIDEYMNNDVLDTMCMVSREMLEQFTSRFAAFLDANLPVNPIKCEYFLPSVANAQIQEGLGRIRVLHTDETWYGVTYREDLESVWSAIVKMKEEGIYPERLWN